MSDMLCPNHPTSIHLYCPSCRVLHCWACWHLVMETMIKTVQHSKEDVVK